MSNRPGRNALHDLFGFRIRAELASALKFYTSSILVDDRVKATLSLDTASKLKELDTAYSQALAFLDYLDGESASEELVQAVREALKDARAEHLLKSNSCKLSGYMASARFRTEPCPLVAVTSAVVCQRFSKPLLLSRLTLTLRSCQRNVPIFAAVPAL